MATLDGAAIEYTAIPLVDDGQVHEVTLRFARPPLGTRWPTSGRAG